jgi:hypothetical protein
MKAIWVELKGLIGTVRLRVQMTPQPPFIKNVTFTLMGLPQVQVSAVPMTERGINVLNLPLISGFVNNSIAAAANEYVAPKSMSLEVGKMLVGDDIKKGTPKANSSNLQIPMHLDCYTSKSIRPSDFLLRIETVDPTVTSPWLTRNTASQCTLLVLS